MIKLLPNSTSIGLLQQAIMYKARVGPRKIPVIKGSSGHVGAGGAKSRKRREHKLYWILEQKARAGNFLCPGTALTSTGQSYLIYEIPLALAVITKVELDNLCPL